MLSKIFNKCATPDEAVDDSIAFVVTRACFFHGERLEPGEKFRASVGEAFDCLASARSRLVRPEDAERIQAEHRRQISEAYRAQRQPSGWMAGRPYGARA